MIGKIVIGGIYSPAAQGGKTGVRPNGRARQNSLYTGTDRTAIFH